MPTRVCSGIVYFNDGFFYHAWVETQLTAGDDGTFLITGKLWPVTFRVRFVA